MANYEWTPIFNTMTSYPSDAFQGTFDGADHVIKNLHGSSSEPDYACAGLFGCIAEGGAVENVTLDNAHFLSTHYAGGICAYTSNEISITNCTVKNSVIESTPEWDGTEYDNGDKVGGIIGYAGGGSTMVYSCNVSNTVVRAYRDLGGVVGAGNLTVQDCTVSDSAIRQDDTHGYSSSPITTLGEIIGRDLGATLVDNVANNVTLSKHETSIYNALELVEFAETVNGGKSFSGLTVNLAADIDLSGVDWTPIGSTNRFEGTFDGQGHSIKNLTSSLDSSIRTQYGNGLFGDVTGGATIKNLIVDNAYVYDEVKDKGNVYGIVCGYAYGNVTFDNITVMNSRVEGFGKVGAILAMAADPGTTVTTVKNCKVINTTIKAAYNCAYFVGCAQNIVSMSNNTYEDCNWEFTERYPATSYYTLPETTIYQYINGNPTGENMIISGEYFWNYAENYNPSGFAVFYNQYIETECEWFNESKTIEFDSYPVNSID